MHLESHLLGSMLPSSIVEVIALRPMHDKQNYRFGQGGTVE